MATSIRITWLNLFLVLTSTTLYSDQTCLILDNIANVFTTGITGLIKFYEEFSQQCELEPPDIQDFEKEYDFIVVGAGTAGCVIANRLTEVTGWNVLLVEAGGPEDYMMDIPLIANHLQFTEANWAYKTEPSDTYCYGFENHQCNWPRGKVVGGSSVLNYMVYTKGAPQDYNNWEAAGNVGWGWDDVLPYFKKVENFNIPEYKNDNYSHGFNGYLNIENAPYRTEKVHAWVEGAREYGFENGDYNGMDPSSVSYLQLSMKDGTRHSSSRAYLHPIKERKNLHLSKNTLVTKLIIDNDIAIGVELEKGGKQFKIYVKKEVIVSAGAINSPQLLMLSGIGPKYHLEEMGIPVVQDLPVGHNLMDHIAAGGLQWVTEIESLSTEYILQHMDLITQWMNHHDGPLSVPGGTEALIFMNLEDQFNQQSWPDIELFFIGGGLKSDDKLKENFGFDKRIFDETYGNLGEREPFMVFPMLMRPKSRGQLKLRDTNPHSHPIIIPNYFEDPEDLQKVVEAMKVAMAIANQPAMRKIGTRLYDEPIKNCLAFGSFGTDAYLACQAQMFTFTIYHQSGTCKMGVAEDPTSVVDPQLRVFGVRNLRVADASIMPMITSGHTNAPVYMIAEKLSDMIKSDWYTY